MCLVHVLDFTYILHNAAIGFYIVLLKIKLERNVGKNNVEEVKYEYT